MNYSSTSLKSFPSPFQRAIMHDSYNPGTSKFSVTTLISPPKRTWLKTLGEEIRSDYSMFAALMGTAMHSILENHVDLSAGEIAEQRFYTKIAVNGVPISVSGQVDFIENKCVYDYKLTGGVQEKMKEAHWLQINMNARLAELNGIEVEHVAVVYVQKDWSHLRSTVDPSYAQTPFTIFLHPYERQLAINTFEKTVLDHEMASQGHPRDCTPEEQWRKPTTYALKKPDGKRASKVCESYAEAEAEKKPGQIIEVRPGEATFCKFFCGMSHLCPQAKKEALQPNNV